MATKLELPGDALAAPRSEVVGLAAILVAALGLRLSLLPTPGFPGDAEYFARWASALLSVPFGDFYSQARDCEYLPGYIYLLAATAQLRALLLGSVGTPQQFLPWVKLAPVAADMVMALAVFQLCRTSLGSRRSLLAAALLAFNPGVIFVGSVWGQVDSVACAFSMLSLATLVSGRPVLAAILGGVAFVVKPQYVFFLAVAGVAYLRAETLRLPPLGSDGAYSLWASWALRRLLAPVVSLLVVVELSLLPFSVSLWPMAGVRWTLFDRLAIAAGKYEGASVNAFNLWGAIAGLSEHDSTRGWLSLSYQMWGVLLLAAVVLLALLLAWRMPDSLQSVLWGCFAVSFGFFTLLTRVHERYLFVAVPLLCAVVAFKRWALPHYLAVTGLYLVNLWYSYVTVPKGYWRERISDLEYLVSASSIFEVLLFVACLVVLIALVLPGRWTAGCRRARAGVSMLTRRPLALNAGLMVAMLLAAPAIVRLTEMAAPWDLIAARGASVVKIRADRLWQDTGVRVSAGQRLSISADGEWTNQSRGPWYGPGGSSRTDGGTIVPSVPVGVLLGRIGDSPPFVVGEGTTVTATSSGSLQLVMNDWPDDRGDSRGSVTVWIRVLESGGPKGS